MPRASPPHGSSPAWARESCDLTVEDDSKGEGKQVAENDRRVVGTMQASINEFFAAIGSHWAGWKSVVVKTIACKTLDRWVNLGTTLTLSSQPVGEPAFFQRELPSAGILVLKQVHQADVLDQLVRDIDAGVLKFPGVDVCFGAVSSSQVSKQPLSWHFSILRRDDPFAWRRVPHCFHTLTANGERLQTLLVAGGHGTEHEVGAALAADAQPYDGLVDLFEEVLTSEMTLASPRRWRDVPDSSFVEILAPLPVVFSPSCRLSEGSLDLELQAPGYEYLVGVNVGVIERSGARTIRRYSIEVDKTGWKTERGVYTHAMSRVVDGATTVTVMLSVRGTLVEKRTLRDYQSSATNPRVAAYSHFDASQEALEKLLSGKGRDDGRRIEVAMAMLMHLLGFSVGPYGVLLAIPEEIDLLAFGRFNRRAIALECTL
jgi:hypothetical protein